MELQGQSPRRKRIRRKKSKLQLFKETYLPLLIAGAALLLIIIFIIGSITRAVQWAQFRKQESLAASIAAAEKQAQLEAEVTALTAGAKALAVTYDYEGAIALLDSFSGDSAQFPVLSEQKQAYEQAISQLVLWEDNGNILHLSFGALVSDLETADNITTEEFSRVLQQLYERDYVLVDMDDITENGQQKVLYLPAGKKPVMLSQTGVNYYTKEKDHGIASKLILDDEGNLTCQYVERDGNVQLGAYDFVPILEAFIYTHPDFAYKNARAILAVTGYDGIFGYRIQSQSRETMGEEAYQKEVEAARAVVQALRKAGYEIACNTYGNIAYGSSSEATVREDLSRWNTEIAPVLGVVRTLVYAKNSDIGKAAAKYTSVKHSALQEAGFTHFIVAKSQAWLWAEDGCTRQGAVEVRADKLQDQPEIFTEMFDPVAVLDPKRQTE